MSSVASRLHAVVRGRVQGVGFRATTLDEARRQGLAGWVRNRTDGSVEVTVEGDEGALRQLLEFLHKGPPGAHVVDVKSEWLPATGASIPFQVRKTE